MKRQDAERQPGRVSMLPRSPTSTPVAATGSDASQDVVPQMKKFKGKDKLFGDVTIRQDGRVIHPMYLFEVKKPDESKISV